MAEKKMTAWALKVPGKKLELVYLYGARRDALYFQAPNEDVVRVTLTWTEPARPAPKKRRR